MVRTMKVENNKTVSEQASDWFALLSADYVTDKDKVTFADWLDLSEVHQQEYEAVSIAWLDLEGVDYKKIEAELGQHHHAPLASWLGQVKEWLSVPKGQLGVGGAVVAMALFLFIFVANPAPYSDNFQTTFGERRTVTLPEGTRITLNTNTRLDIAFLPGARQVILKSGEAFFDVSHDASRPFTVKTAGGEVQVLGTKFNVRLRGEHASVALIEGRLKISTPLGGESKSTEAYLTSGHTVSYSETAGILPVSNAEQAPLIAWQESKFVFEGTRLVDVIADVNRYTEEVISITDASIGDIQVTGTFSTDRIPELLSNLERIVPIQVVYKDSDTILIKPKNND